jgi:hypothetical protein
MMKKLTIAAIMALALTPITAQAQAQADAPACISQDEAENLIRFAYPATLTSLNAACEKKLDASAGLAQITQDLAAHAQPESDSAWPLAKKSIITLYPEAALGSFLGDAKFKVVALSAAAKKIAAPLAKFTPEDCAQAARMLKAGQSLSSSAVATILVAAAQIGANQTKVAIPICKPL